VVLSTVAGDQLPVIGIASDDAAGNTGAALPAQIAASAANVGVGDGDTVCTIVVVVAH
jgi:hypothetical protein